MDTPRKYRAARQSIHCKRSQQTIFDDAQKWRCRRVEMRRSGIVNLKDIAVSVLGNRQDPEAHDRSARSRSAVVFICHQIAVAINVAYLARSSSNIQKANIRNAAVTAANTSSVLGGQLLRSGVTARSTIWIGAPDFASSNLAASYSLDSTSNKVS